ncbi:MAG: metallophosphatase domain-containing protein [Flavisolibacter sp.]|nr:metallophosphatase domain-containing protein [Flavisolibacter sp.]
MKFVAISDTHCRQRVLKLPKADAIIHAGDISYKGKEVEVIDFFDWFSSLPYTNKICIAGNHDFFFEKEKQEIIKKRIPGNVIYLQDSGVEIEGIKIWGSPVTPWFFNWAFNRKRGLQLLNHWKLIPPDTDVLITHGPPYGILDNIINETNAGCVDLLKTVQQLKPKVHVFGHIHESYGQVKRNGVHYINASLLNESYELVNKPILFDVINSGNVK